MKRQVATPEEEEILNQFLRDMAQPKTSVSRRAKHSKKILEKANEVVTAGLRQLAKTHHPDLSGSEDQQRELNLAVQFLRNSISTATK